jgi:cytochrome c oxidase subunit 4
MAQHPTAAGHHVDHPLSPAAHADVHHPSWKTYVIVGVFLTLITAVEVWVYYVPAIVESRVFVPLLLVMSAVKFVTVVLFYMHLKYDHKIFRALFTGPFLIAAGTLFAFLFLFGQIAIRLGMLN